jgi:polyphosphate glucokinase
MDSITPRSAPLTLAIDIGGSHLKAGVLDAAGAFVAGPDRVATPRPATPQAVVEALTGLARDLGPFDRVSVGFPGVVREGRVLTAPNLDNRSWHAFPFATTLTQRMGKPVRLLNDAEVQGLGVIAGKGLECVITLGTGMGFALFHNGLVAPHLELSQHPIHKGKTYDEYIGAAALKEVGPKRWNRRVTRALRCIGVLVMPDMLHIGGGNAKHLTIDLPSNARVVSNQAGITGGVRLWDHTLDASFAP